MNPDQVHYEQARIWAASSFAADVETNVRHGAPVAYSPVDWVSPQVFTKHPSIAGTPVDAVLGGDAAAPSLPGRPVQGWDGEPGASSPIGVL